MIVPGLLPAPIVEKSIPVERDFEVRAIYLTGIMAASDHGIRIIKHWREVGGNAVVFDIKDSDGSVNIPFEHPLLGSQKSYFPRLPKFIRFLHPKHARHRPHRHLPRRAPGGSIPNSLSSRAGQIKLGAKTASWSGPIPPSPKFRTMTSPWPSKPSRRRRNPV